LAIFQREEGRSQRRYFRARIALSEIVAAIRRRARERNRAVSPQELAAIGATSGYPFHSATASPGSAGCAAWAASPQDLVAG